MDVPCLTLPDLALPPVVALCHCAGDCQAEIEEFVEASSMRLVTTFSAESSAAIFGGNVKVIF